MAKTTIQTREVKERALKQELGRRRNNKARPAGEKVRSRAYYLAALSGEEIKALLDGGEVTKTYKSSNRTEKLVLAS